MSNRIQGFILYKIFCGSTLVYLGRTKQPLASRLRGHFFQKPMHRVIDISLVTKVQYARFQTEANMNLYEIYFILTLHPPLNVDDKAGDYPTVTLPEVEWTDYWPPLMEKWLKEIGERTTRYEKLRLRQSKILMEQHELRVQRRSGALDEESYWQRYEELVQEDQQIRIELHG
ncbi:hypothetical protein [uncultured Dysosmobacter sp.]|uniref:hypothetical protein n=1 Tax=uncultured Dysosmobacter sp. TaxID=2591384 RepID=UPI0026202040|nr:hypothetical protein [uncultured Dysosmobacter sp.]